MKKLIGKFLWTLVTLILIYLIVLTIFGCARPRYAHSLTLSVTSPEGSISEMWIEESEERPENWPMRKKE